MSLHLGDTDKSTQEELQFEYLKNWISSVHNREVAENVTCPFKSLALGISEAMKEVEEKQIRSTLIESYRKLTGPALDALLCEKHKQETSFFHMTQFRDVEEIRRHWNWYLYCLTFESWQFEQENLPNYVVRVPMDYIDLQVLATCFRAKITVSHLDSLALCFTPRSSELWMHLHLVHHRSRWAPMLGRKAAVQALENQLVILHGLEGSGFQSFKNKPAYVLSKRRHFPPEVYLVNVGAQILPMQRHQPHVIDDAEADHAAASDSCPGLDRSRGPAIGQAPPFRGIPDGSMEFQLLLELVGDLIYKRLRQKRDELLGKEADYERRGPDDASQQLAALPDWVSQASTPQAMPNGAGAPATPRVTQDRRFVVERRPLDEVVAVMKARQQQKQTNRIRVRCPSTFSSDKAMWREYFTIDCKKGMHIVLMKAKDHKVFRFIFRGAKDGEEDKTSWFASDLLCLWEVQEQMTVPSVTTRTPVDLQAGTALCVTHLNILGEADSSAEMMEWKKEGRGGLKLNLRDQRLRPFLCIAQGDLSPQQPRNGDASVEV